MDLEEVKIEVTARRGDLSNEDAAIISQSAIGDKEEASEKEATGESGDAESAS